MGQVTEQNRKWAEGLYIPSTFTDDDKEEVMAVINSVYEDGKVDGALDGLNTHQILTYLRDNRKIALSAWYPEDIQERATEIGLGELTDEQMVQTIGYLDRNHDATTGINWDVIDTTLEILFT